MKKIWTISLDVAECQRSVGSLACVEVVTGLFEAAQMRRSALKADGDESQLGAGWSARSGRGIASRVMEVKYVQVLFSSDGRDGCHAGLLQ